MNEQKEINNKNINSSVSGKKSTNMLLGAFMMFIVPIMLVSLGAFVGGYIGEVIGVSVMISQVIGGVMGFVLSAVVIKVFDKASKTDENTKKIEWDDL